MGGVTDFLFGKPSKQTNTSSSSNSATSGNQSYDTLSQALGPTLGYGAQAGNMMGALLGLPSSSPATPAPSPSYNPSTPAYNPTPSYGSGGGYNPYQTVPGYGGTESGGRMGARFNLADSYNEGDGGVNYPGPVGNETPYPVQGLLNESRPQTAPSVTPQGAGSALEDFSNSAGMDFLRNQGVKAIEASQAGKGMLQSGATGQALTSFGNNLSKTYLNDYLTHLSDYAGLGTKNAAVLSGAGGYSNSSGLSSGSGSGNGGKNGLVNTLAGNSGIGSMIAAFA